METEGRRSPRSETGRPFYIGLRIQVINYGIVLFDGYIPPFQWPGAPSNERAADMQAGTF
jgi:hypothetical protein